MHEGERRGRGKGVAARVGAAEIAAMGKGSAQEGRPPSHRNAPSGHSGVPVGLFYAKSTQNSLLQNARPSGSLRSPYGCLRTEMPLRDIPVLRMAYFTIPHRPTFGALVFRSAYSASRNARASAASRPPWEPHCGLISKTLMLQVRRAHPAPSHRNAPSGHSGVPVGLFYAKSTQYSLLQNARPSGSLRSPCGGLRTGTSLRNVPVLRMAYLNKRATCALLFKTLMLQVRRTHPAGRGEPKIPPSPFPAGAGTSEKEIRQKTEGRSAEKLLK